MAQITPSERNALVAIEALDDPARLRKFINNARSQNSAIVERAAFARLCLVQPEANPGTVEHDVWQSIFALEEMRCDERGKTVRLTRTRQKIARDGEAKTASDLTLRPEASAGFTDLIERGHPELTFEVVVLRHPKTFGSEVQDAAKTRLIAAGIDPMQYTRPSRGE